MNDTESTNTSTSENYWTQLFLMAIMAAGVFASIEYVPSILNGTAGIIVALIAASVFLYSFGRVTGRMLAGIPS